MDTKRIFPLLILIGLCCFGHGHTEQAYREKALTQGKIIYGLSEPEALNKYGVPTAIRDNLWLYEGAEKLYIYMEEPLKVYLYPRFIEGRIGSPLELRTLSGSREITDVTTQAEFLISDPEGFNIVGKGVLMPRKPGKYQVISVYKGQNSNASFITVTDSKEEPETEEQLVSIDTFPYKPYVNPDTSVYFYAFGTFVFKGDYSVREITRQVEWFSEQDGQILKLKDSKVAFPYPGKSKIFCRYKGLQSMPQDVEVAKSTEQLNRYLKQISILPSDVAVTTQTNIPFYAFASYGDNSMEEVTKKIGWVIKDNAILERESDNIFVAKLIGVTELQGVLENMRSIASKVAVSGSPVGRGKDEKARKQKISAEDLFDDIKSDIKDLDKKVTEEKLIKYIKIVPDYCDIPAGAQKQLVALAVRQDNSEEDVTILGKWKTLDDKTATVSSGLVNAVYPGETKVCIRYKNIENQCIPVIVGEAKLVSIAVSPQQAQIAKGEHLDFKAEGYFGDSSHRDVTLSANWTCENINIAKMDKNSILPIRVGETRIFAEYSGVRSLPAAVQVVEEKYWLLKLIIKILFFTALALSMLYTYLYIMVERSRGYILSLYSDPRDFTIALYRNLTKIISIFGIQHKFYMPPLFLAGLADEKYGIKDNLFLKFTQQYEEAKYSSHVFPPETSRSVLDAYNHILEAVFAQQKKGALFYRHLQALFRGMPLFIHKP